MNLFMVSAVLLLLLLHPQETNSVRVLKRPGQYDPKAPLPAMSMMTLNRKKRAPVLGAKLLGVLGVLPQGGILNPGR